ncbi:MAG: hypothetical protein NDJ89_15220 [Oligoflexia bacterium]|nr:hypothetical protein [Oligoflexia bacterium]
MQNRTGRWISFGIVTFAAAMAAAPSDTQGASTCADVKGINCPVQLPAAATLPAPRKGCDAPAWNAGLKESLGGLHSLFGYILKGQAQLKFEGDQAIKDPRGQGKACMAYRAMSDEKNSPERLQCCIDAFYKGLEIQAVRIDSEFKGEELTKEMKDCRISYGSGEADGWSRCEYDKAVETSGERRSCPKFKLEGVTHPGCYQIGFLRAVVTCGCTTARASIPMLKEKAPAIFDIPGMPEKARQSIPPAQSRTESRDAERAH